MIRVLNFFCVAFMGLAILALYHVSEATRVARVELSHVNSQIADTKGEIGVLQTEWESVAGPARIQQLAQQQLGMTDATSVRLSSFEQLPRKGDAAPLGNTPLHNASAVISSPQVSNNSVPLADASNQGQPAQAGMSGPLADASNQGM
jgi:cell division protein FtsL